MSERIPSIDMAEALDAMAYGKVTWLSDFSDGRNKRPDHEIEHKRRELDVLKQAAREYRASAEKLRQMQEAVNG